MTAGLCIALARRRSAADWFALATLGVVTIYFVFTDRLILPFFVFALAATVGGLRDMAGRFGGPRAAMWVPAGALLLLIAIDMKPREDWRAIEARHREFASLASAIESVLAPDALLAAGQGFHYGVYLDRPVYSLVHAVRRAHRRDAVEQINMSLQEQSSACSQVAEFLEQVVDRTRGNERAAEGMGDAVESLIRQAEALREDVARFQIS